LNWEHLKAVVWLRQRLLRNWLRRSGMANTVITAILLSLALIASVSMFFVSIVVGVKVLPHASPELVLFVWNVLISMFLVSWTIGLVTELQRSEVISFQKLLYFPISLSGTFLVNYLGSFASFTLIAFLPTMIGLCIASVVALGPSFLVTFPLLACLVLMVTAVTYQFRGWLAALMVNKRRRRTLVALITAGFVIVAQIPQLLNRYFLVTNHQHVESKNLELQKLQEETNKLAQQIDAHKIDAQLAQKRLSAIQDRAAQLSVDVDRQKAMADMETEDVARWLRTIDLFVPPGWMAYGAMAAARHSVWPGLLGSLGMCAIGAASLRRSYRTTLRFYRGEFQTGQVAKKTAPTEVSDKRATLLVERQLPWLSEQAAATTLASLRSLIRAPEVKMMLLSTIVVAVIFASSLLAGRGSRLPVTLRPLMAMGIITMESLSLSQIFQNQFGFDRSGFRTLLLSPACRRDILLGKNLSLAPLCLGIGAFALVILECLYPLAVTHFIASLAQLVSAFLIVCMIGNYTSILLPNAVRAGALRASTTTLSGTFLRLLAVFCLMLSFIPLFIPLGVELLLHNLELGRPFPIYLILALLELGVLILLYRLLLESQGILLQSREQRILEAVTTKND
jgi:ABC-2 type transport system permease protein